MTPRERVLAALNHEPTDRVPCDVTHGQFMPDLERRMRLHFSVNDTEAINVALGIDARWIKPVYRRPPESPLGQEQVTWFGTTDGLLSYADGLGLRPLRDVGTIAEVERFFWPDPDWFDYEAAATLAAQYSRYALVGGYWNPVFCRICDLCGMEHALMLLLDRPAVVEAMIEHITAFNLGYYQRLFDAAPDIDILFVGDDAAGQQGLLISRQVWCRYFNGPLRRIFDLAHQRGKRVMFHICGAARELIPDLLDIGLDVLEPVQTSATGMDPGELKKEFGRSLSFWGGIDIQHTLPFGTEEEVRAAARERIEVLGEGGGYVLGPSHSLLDDVPSENVLAMYDEARRFCRSQPPTTRTECTHVRVNGSNLLWRHGDLHCDRRPQ